MSHFCSRSDVLEAYGIVIPWVIYFPYHTPTW